MRVIKFLRYSSSVAKIALIALMATADLALAIPASNNADFLPDARLQQSTPKSIQEYRFVSYTNTIILRRSRPTPRPVANSNVNEMRRKFLAERNPQIMALKSQNKNDAAKKLALETEGLHDLLTLMLGDQVLANRRYLRPHLDALSANIEIVSSNSVEDRIAAAKNAWHDFSRMSVEDRKKLVPENLRKGLEPLFIE